jgi:DNA-binding transcriptional LysR family regulator
MRTSTLRNFDLNALRAFAAVAESGGFTAAADRLGTAKARVSLDVARLEKQLRTDLFTRTTRRVALTEAGRTFYSECIPLLRRVEGLVDRLRGDQTQLSGTLRLTATVDLAAQSLAKAVAAFSAIHPELRIELITSDRVVNLVEEGIDVGIRVGWLRDSSLRATKLGNFEQYVVTSTSYLARAGSPTKPEDLEEHAWIALTRLPAPLTWKFTGSSGERRTVRVRAKLRTDTGTILRALLESGAGISILDSLSSAEAIEAGRLKRILTRWSLPSGGVYAVYPPGRHAAPAARAFVEFYRTYLDAGSST